MATLHKILNLDISELVIRVGVATSNLPKEDRLKLSGPNAKTKAMLGWLKEAKGKIVRPSEFVSISLLSGISCPGANVCKSMAVLDPATGKRTIKDSPDCKFRCFSANDESTYTETFAQREHNRSLILKHKNSAYTIAAMLVASIPKKVKLVRFHIGGDFFCYNYLLAVVIAARCLPGTRFYFYTKSLHFLDRFKCNASDLPSNLSPVMSEGGLFDAMIPGLKARGFRSARVVFSPEEASKAGLEIDHRDNLAAYGDKDFALLIHGCQPKGSDAGKAVHAMRKAGVKVGYVRKSTEQARKKRSAITK